VTTLHATPFRLTDHGRSVATVALLALVAVVLAGCAAPADTPSGSTSAPPPPSSSTAPVSVEELAKGEQTAAVDVEVGGPAQVVFRRITIAPGAGTGRHCHAGQLVAVVEKGELTHYAPVYPGGVHVYKTGDSIVEGARYVHEGKNLGTDDVVLLVTYVIAEGQPLAQTDLAKCAPPGTT
jgi:quercetin dioxygenase-like cupin family protein